MRILHCIKPKKNAISFALTIGILAAGLAPARAAVTGPKKLSDGAQYTVAGGTLRIQFWSPEIARVTYAPGDALPTNKSLAVVASPASVSLKRQVLPIVFAIIRIARLTISKGNFFSIIQALSTL